MISPFSSLIGKHKMFLQDEKQTKCTLLKLAAKLIVIVIAIVNSKIVQGTYEKQSTGH